MDRIRLFNVPVKVKATVSPEYYAAVRSEAVSRLDLPGLLNEGLRRGGDAGWVDQQTEQAGQIMQDIDRRAKLEGGRVALRAQGGLAVVGQPLQTFLLTLADGKVVSIEGGGSAD